MIKTVSVLVLDGVAPFEFGVICEVFGIDRSADGVPNFEFKICGPEPGRPLRMTVGASLIPDHGYDALIGADLVAVPAIAGPEYPPAALDALRAAAASGSIILTVCSGAFVVGAAGLLDGRRCTTHWMHADALAELHPTAEVDRNVLYVDDGNLITSAGTAAGIDACLHLVRRELGSEITNIVARRMVVPPQRDGGQRQYIDQPIPVRFSEGFAPQLDWILAHLDEPHTVAALAKRASMTARTFARRFVDETGRTPMQWVTDQRVLYARRLLEETDLDVDRVADRSGFGTSTLLRYHFRRVIGVTPSDYRRNFARDDSDCAATASGPAPRSPIRVRTGTSGRARP